jgi:hypothetical protein
VVYFNSELTYKMTTFTDYLQNIQLTMFEYLCDIIIRNSDDENDNYPSYSMVLYNQHDLYRNNEFSNRHIFNSFKRNFTNYFYNGERMLLYYGSRSIPTEYRADLIRELKLLVPEEGPPEEGEDIVPEEGENYYRIMVKCGEEEGTYDDKIIIHYFTRYAIQYISLTNFINYYDDKINARCLK